VKKTILACTVLASVGGALATAVIAGVGSSPPLLPPIKGNICPEIGVVAQMSDPNYFSIFGAVLTLKSCSALCKVAVAECRHSASAAAACNDAVLKGALTTLSAGCAISPVPYGSDISSCRKGAATALAEERLGVRSELLSARDDCIDWGQECTSDCQQLGAG